ncbi:VWA domain-containing protein [Granulicella tundricola]|uniref:VWFA-related domain protein n=1 Tax=Granulicella tundricola (strain ATCC BAA-1859 / DSM 23138 / MP5ACTX9) TaxID=1198114 RepID=E8X087_GRATM|nr:VWA domain-containing protein [Granulicella tundricola]ADW70068.1 VWFA-related domain protein [Granulicella tundricola MP5ACTX9]
MSRTSPLFAAAFLTATLTVSAFSQQLTPAPAVSSAPAPSRLMTLDVVVAPKSGVPVAGLPQSAFTLLDNGRSEEIKSFREVKGGATNLQVILVIDSVNARFSTVSYERQEIGKYLLADGGRLAHPTALAIMTDTGIQMQQGYSTDGKSLNESLEQSVIGLREIRRNSGFYGAEERLDDSLRSLNLLIQHEKTVPGRKLVLWISPGWPLLSGPAVDLSSKQRTALFRSVVQTSTELRQAGVTLYNLNPVGVGEDVGRAFYYQEFLKGVTAPNHVDLGDLGLQVIATQSGGLVDMLNSDVAAMIRRDVRDADVYYELSFTPAPGEDKIEYHGLQVKVPDTSLTARTRQGYYALPPGVGTDQPIVPPPLPTKR